MPGIFGIFHRDHSPVAPRAIEAMRDAMAYWGRVGGDLWLDGACGLGQLRTFTTPEARYETLPRVDTTSGIVLTAAARIDNREELCLLSDFCFQISAQPDTSEVINLQSKIPDGELMLRAYLRWGEECVRHLIGDWAFAVWDPRQRMLFLARDHHGISSIYYYSHPRRFAFASSIKRARSGFARQPHSRGGQYVLDLCALANRATARSGRPADGTNGQRDDLVAGRRGKFLAADADGTVANVVGQVQTTGAVALENHQATCSAPRAFSAAPSGGALSLSWTRAVGRVFCHQREIRPVT